MQPTREQFIDQLFSLKKEDNIHTNEKLISGIEKGINAVKSSYGASGSNVVVQEDIYPFSRTTNDGRIILKDIKLSDPVENVGMHILRECADKSDKESGDGRKTSIILLGAILEEGKKIQASPMELKKSLDECLPIVLSEIDKQTQPITAENIDRVASIASESPKLGEIYRDIYTKIGQDGIVEIDNSNLPETFYEITEGIRLPNCTYTYPYMANDDKSAVYKYPKVLITKEKLTALNLTYLSKIVNNLADNQRDELVIFADEIDLAVSQVLAKLQLEGLPNKDGMLIRFKTLVIKAPTLWKDWCFEDFAEATNATIIDPSLGRTLRSFKTEWFGTCDKITVTKNETIILGGQDLTEYINELLTENTDDAKIRASRLKTKTAILKIGANSETELAYTKAKALDGRNASYLALNGGIVEGGGYALYKLSDNLPDTLGGNVLKNALKYPFNQICANMGIKSDKPFNIPDPARVIKNSFINALSIASMVLTTNKVITK